MHLTSEFRYVAYRSPQHSVARLRRKSLSVGRSGRRQSSELAHGAGGSRGAIRGLCGGGSRAGLAGGARRGPRGPAARARRRPRRPAPHTRNLFISSYVKFTRNTRYCIQLMLLVCLYISSNENVATLQANIPSHGARDYVITRFMKENTTRTVHNKWYIKKSTPSRIKSF